MISAGNSKRAERELRDNIENQGTVCPVDDLQSKGIREIRVLSQSQLQDTVRVAINRVLRDQIGDLPVSAELAQAIEERAHAEFGRLVRTGLENFEDTVPAPPPPAPAPVVEPAPESEPVILDPSPSESWVEPLAPSAPQIPEAIQAEDRQLADLAGAGHRIDIAPPEAASMEAVEERMASNISNLLAEDIRNSLQRVEDSHRAQVEVLEARIAKLAAALESTDRVLRHMQDGGQVGATGGATETPASLDPSSPLFVKKSQLLDALFQANVTLRELQEEDNN